jgi:hypothetical protein
MGSAGQQRDRVVDTGGRNLKAQKEGWSIEAVPKCGRTRSYHGRGGSRYFSIFNRDDKLSQTGRDDDTLFNGKMGSTS